MENIKKLLLDLNFNLDSFGSIYWLEVFEYLEDKPINTKFKEVLFYVSSLHGITPHALESYLRRSVEPAEKLIQKKFRYYGKITCKTFMNLVRFWVR
jgi:hypothetical protein